MVFQNSKRLVPVIFFLLVCTRVFAQGTSQTDSLVRLENAKSIELIHKEGDRDYRKAVQATFLHNGTFLICDTALWNVDAKIINCLGNVQLIQDETTLTSDRLDYYIDENLAEFRGSIVQLTNKTANILRTNYLDYNTKDSVAVFSQGASMIDKDGQIIESDNGTYESARKLFSFIGNVNMFSDSVFVRTASLDYDTGADRADFKSRTDFWKDDNMLSAEGGWYDHKAEIFFFAGSVHGLSKEQESWSDSLYFYRLPNDIKMLGNAHVQDSVRNVAAMGDYLYYCDSLSKITLSRRAAVALKDEQENKTDTLYCGADTLVYHTVKRCDIPESEVNDATSRRTEMLDDAVSAYRARVAKEAEEEALNIIKEAEESGEILPGLAESRYGKIAAAAAAAEAEKESAAEQPRPSEETVPAVSDSLAVPPADSLAVTAPDTTKVGFLYARGNVKVFKSDMQLCGGKLLYNDLDSIARLYEKPIVWNEIRRQYTSDSLFILVRNGRADRASLMSNAFIACKESDRYYDQIKGTDVVAFFDKNSALSRFDALGGASALFYLKEDDVVATVNRVECKLFTAALKEGTVERVNYFEMPKNDAYPVVQLPTKEHTLKGFDWKPDDRPASKDDITTLSVIASERSYYESKEKPSFDHTEKYFPGHMHQLYADIELARLRKQQKRDSVSVEKVPEPELEAETETPADSTTLAPAALVTEVSDSVAVNASDSLSLATPLEGRALRKEQRENARKMRIARRDARWAALDAKDAAKAEAKRQKALERQRARTKLLYIRQLREDAEDAAKLQSYIDKYTKKKQKKDERVKQQAPDGGDPLFSDDGNTDGGDLLGGSSLPWSESGPGL